MPHILEHPDTDPAWADLLTRHPAASVFHSPAWLRALRVTYGYEPFVATTSPGGVLDNGIVLCRVNAWGGRRLVSLPFSDHCDPLVHDAEELAVLLAGLEPEVDTGRWRSLELRPRIGSPLPAGRHRLCAGRSYYLHSLDLTRSAAEIFSALHPTSTRRAIRRAEREGLTYESGTSERLFDSFYGLLRLTRRRHGLPPQPRAWFENLMRACPAEPSHGDAGERSGVRSGSSRIAFVGSGFSRLAAVGSGFSRIAPSQLATRNSQLRAQSACPPSTDEARSAPSQLATLNSQLPAQSPCPLSTDEALSDPSQLATLNSQLSAQSPCPQSTDEALSDPSQLATLNSQLSAQSPCPQSTDEALSDPSQLATLNSRLRAPSHCPLPTVHCPLPAPRATLHLASKDGQPIGALLTLTFRTTLVYKYGGSDARYHRLGVMPFLFWRAIEAAKAEGLSEFDLGRSDLDQPGLIAFKDHLGATASPVTYYSYPQGSPRSARDGTLSRAARRVVSHLPDPALDLAGRLLYRHMG